MKHLLFIALLLPATARSQAIIDSWIMNDGGTMASQWSNNGGNPITYTFVTMTDSADALKVCYTADSVWVVAAVSPPIWADGSIQAAPSRKTSCIASHVIQ
jgi:hypothetical protein